MAVDGGRKEAGEVQDKVRPGDVCLGDSSLN